MPFDGSGNWSPVSAPAFPAVAGQTIASAYYNQVINDIAVAFNNVLTRDGQGKPTAPINWNGQNLTNVNAFAAATGTFSGNITAANLGTVAPLAVDLDGTMAANSDTRVPSQKAIVTYVSNAVTGLLAFKGSTDCSTNPNYPAANKGDAYMVSVAGKIGGASGPSVNAGDVFFATANNAGGTQAAVGASWDILEHTLNGALLVANNLSDVANTATARANIGARSATLNVQSVASAATVTPTFSNDMVTITAQAAALTLANPTGPAIEGWGIVIRIKDNGTPQTIAFGAQYRAIGVALPITTVASKTLYIAMVFNNVDTMWDVLSVCQQ